MQKRLEGYGFILVRAQEVNGVLAVCTQKTPTDRHLMGAGVGHCGIYAIRAEILKSIVEERKI